MMASFFKTKASPQPVLDRTPSTPTVSVPTVSDFDKTFKPFVLKKGTVMAPVNAFRVKRRKTEREVIVIDDEDIVETDGEVEVVETPVQVLKPGYKRMTCFVRQTSRPNELISFIIQPHLFPARPLHPHS